jgi:hypothetical protein
MMCTVPVGGGHSTFPKYAVTPGTSAVGYFTRMPVAAIRPHACGVVAPIDHFRTGDDPLRSRHIPVTGLSGHNRRVIR